MLRATPLLLLAAAVCCFLSTAVQAQHHSHLISDPELDGVWELFKDKFLKRFTDRDHEVKRRHIFEEHLEKIREHNIEADLGKHSFRMGLTPFADWTREEFRSYLNLKLNASSDTESDDFSAADPKVTMVTSSNVPDSINWVTQGAVTGVKNQGSCGACYTFSATGALEAQHFLKTGNLVSLSEQNILDCSGSQGNQGCNGGAIQYAFRYVQTNGGIDTEASYPYTGKQDTCNYNPSNNAASCTGYQTLPTGDESALQQAVGTVGPVSVAIDASTMQFYRSGVYSSSKCSSTELNHAVLVVGYGTSSSGQQYWQVKNSWGTRWGMDGYIELARNDNNMCGIASSAVYPVV
jgi:cathepsin L